MKRFTPEERTKQKQDGPSQANKLWNARKKIISVQMFLKDRLTAECLTYDLNRIDAIDYLLCTNCSMVDDFKFYTELVFRVPISEEDLIYKINNNLEKIISEFSNK